MYLLFGDGHANAVVGRLFYIPVIDIDILLPAAYAQKEALDIVKLISVIIVTLDI